MRLRLRNPLLLTLLLAPVALALGCDRHVEDFVPGEEPKRPDLSRIFPPEQRPDEPPGPARMPAPPGAPSAAPPLPPGAPAGGAAAAASPVRGTISVAPELADRVPREGVIFLFARPVGGGPPVAARRLPVSAFPLDFELGPADRMVQGIPFRGPFQLVARIDADGNATTRAPGDLQGAAPAPVNPGESGVAIVLDEAL